MVDFSKPAPEEKVYPATHHFKIIADAVLADKKALAKIAEAFTVKSPLKESRASSAGKYISFDISVFFTSRSEHLRFHELMKSAPGVKILL